MLPAILAVLGNVLPDVIKRVLPSEKISEEDAAKLQHEISLVLIKQNWDEIRAEYDDRNSARNLAGQDIAKSNALTGFLSAVVRPMWGIGAFALVAYSWLRATPIDPAMHGIITTVLMFYFGGRVIEKVTPHITEAMKK